MSKGHPAKRESLRQTQSAPVPSTLPSAITQLFRDYRLSLEALGRSTKTIISYFEILERYLLFLMSKTILRPVPELGRRELSAYLAHLQNCKRWPKRLPSQGETGKLSPFTIQVHARAIKAFWGWLYREGYIEKNPLDKFPLPSVPKRLMNIVTPEQFEMLLGKIDRSTPTGTQRYCILLTLYDAGPRISESLTVLTDNVDMNLGSMKVIGKGNKERDVPISRMTVREIRRYVREYRSQICPVDSAYLFPRSDGTPVSVNSIQQFMRRLAKKAGLDGIKLHPHLLRHTFGTQFIINGGNVFFLKEIMGHASLSTTLKYTHLQSEDLRREHSKYSPVGNLRISQKSHSGKQNKTGGN